LNPEPGTRNLDILPPVSPMYFRVVLLETAIIIGLIVLGRFFS
jgi:hypothetical protein